MKKMIAILSLLAVLTACAEQPAMEKADVVELTAATSETAFAETESSPAPAVAQAATPNAEPTAAPTPEPTAEPTPLPTQTPAPVPTAAPTESPAVQAAEAPAQVSVSYGAVPFDLAAGTEQWWSIDSSDSAYWAVQENINAMRTAGGLAPLAMDGGLSAAADARC